MADFIEPLSLQKIFISVFSGTPEIFTALALMTIAGMCAFFRLPLIGLFFIMGVFLLMFSGFISSPIVVLMAIIGGLVLGFIMAKIFGQ